MPNKFGWAVLCLFLGALLPGYGLSTPAEPVPDQSQEQTLLATIQHALKENFGIRISNLESQLGQWNVEAKRALYDIITSAALNHTVDRKEPAISVFGDENNTTNFELGIRKQFPTGTGASVTWRTQRTDTNSPFTTLNPTSDAALELALTQPLLQNFLGRNPRLTVAIAKTEDEILGLMVEDQIETILALVVAGYWQLAYQKQRLAYNEEAVRWAQKLLASNRKKLNLGLVEASDLIAAQANLSVREQQQLASRFDTEAASLRLAQLANLPRRRDYVAIDQLAEKRTLPDINQARSTAMASRRDRQVLLKELDNAKIQISIDKNSLWPSLDLAASFALNGLDGSFGGAQGEIFETDTYTFFIGGVMSYNWDNRAHRASLQSNRIRQEQKLVQMKENEQTILFDIERVVLELETQKALVEKAKKVVELQRKKLNEEEKRVRQGRSDVSLLVRHQDDLITAQQASLQNQLVFQLASDLLQRTQNTLLTEYTRAEEKK